MKAQESYRASAPGSLMMMGEHAVLRGKLALASAVDQRITVTMTPAERVNGLVIISELGRYEGEIRELPDDPQFRFVVGAIRHCMSWIDGGLMIEIDSSFSSKLGLGSSAAVSVATVAALSCLSKSDVSHRDIFDIASSVVRTAQGSASCTDVAASVYGGIIAYRMDPVKISPLGRTHPIALVYAGYKKATAEVIQIVNEAERENPALYQGIFNGMEEAALRCRDAVLADDWSEAGVALDQGQRLMEELGLSDDTLSSIVGALREDPGILGAKISGSGLGDCVLGLGVSESSGIPGTIIEAQLSTQGVKFE